MLRAGQRDIKQAQVFCQPLVIGLLNQRLGGLQTDLRTAIGIMKLQRQAAAIDWLGRADERQEHQRVLQPLGFVDGNDFDQLLVAFQAQDLFFSGLPGQRQVIAQMTNQRLLAIQLGGGLLQQF